MLDEGSLCIKNTTNLKIQQLNNELQSYINMIYNYTGNDINIIDEMNADIKDYILYSIDTLYYILNDFIVEIKDYYRLRYYNNFKVSMKLFDFINDNIDYLNISSNSKFMSETEASVVFKYMNMTLINDIIISEIEQFRINEEFCDDDIYTTNDIITDLDFILNDFYCFIENLKKLCNTETNVYNMIQYYIFEMRMIAYIKEFAESIQHV